MGRGDRKLLSTSTQALLLKDSPPHPTVTPPDGPDGGGTSRTRPKQSHSCTYTMVLLSNNWTVEQSIPEPN